MLGPRNQNMDLCERKQKGKHISKLETLLMLYFKGNNKHSCYRVFETLFSLLPLPMGTIEEHGKMPSNLKKNSILAPYLNHASPTHSVVAHSEECDISKAKIHQPAFPSMTAGWGSTCKLAELAQSSREQKKRLGVREMRAVQFH